MRCVPARPSADCVAAVATALDGLCRSAAEATVGTAPAAVAQAPVPPALKPLFAVDCGAPIVALEAGGDRLYAASAREITVLDGTGAKIGAMQTQGDIRALHWWPEPGLLLAGCADEKVMAFRPDGTLAWTFVSEMDRAVWEAAKQYWFKSAHPGIYGLDTGALLDRGTQCFVGSACTLEILAADGVALERAGQLHGQPPALSRQRDPVGVQGRHLGHGHRPGGPAGSNQHQGQPRARHAASQVHVQPSPGGGGVDIVIVHGGPDGAEDVVALRQGEGGLEDPPALGLQVRLHEQLASPPVQPH